MTMPSWLRHDDHDVDRVLIAAWLRRRGDYDPAMAIFRIVVPVHREAEYEHQLMQLVELLGEWDHCYEDPRGYAFVSEGLELHGDVEAWAVTRCEAIAADAAMLAEQVVASVRSPLTLVGGS